MTTTSTSNRWTTDWSELGAGPVPLEPFVAPEYYARERERIFRRVWLNVGREEEIARPGISALGIDRTLWETGIYFPPAQNAGQRFSQEYAKCALRDTLREDGNTLEDIQRNLASGAKTHFVLHDEEILIRHSHKVVSDIVGR